MEVRLSTEIPVFPSTAVPPGRAPSWRFSALGWGAIAIVALAALQPFVGILGALFDVWNLRPEYSHGIVIPIVSVFLIWRQRARLSRMPLTGSWLGPVVTLFGFFLWYASAVSTVPVIGEYAFVVVLYGVVLALTGLATFRVVAVPLFILLFMIPLPAFFSNSISLNLQLLSSAIGVGIIRAFGISVFLEGNVIDLGTLKLQVVEACDGLRYLYPLMTLAFIVAYFLRVSFWKRAVLFLASIPIAILMNSARIGLIGVTVEYWGERMAEGILHDFEGWVVFMLSLLVLLGLAAALNRIGRPGARLRDVLALDFGEPLERRLPSVPRAVPAAFLAAGLIALVSDVVGMNLPERVELAPVRQSFADFPTDLGGWQGHRMPLEREYADDLHLDDYLLADYRPPAGVGSGAPVNAWIAWYNSQRSGASTHSPRSCLPGGGWKIAEFGRRTIPLAGGRVLPVNRALIEQGESRQLVYYWFQQRGRAITDEYLVKWYIFYDAITRNRTDGALVRLIVPLSPTGDDAVAERGLVEFTRTIAGALPRYLPD
jgi:exosortase D (VPLPA-CTERM-specific)